MTTSTNRTPRYLILQDERAAYAARYHNIVPEGNELRRIIVREYGGACACCGESYPTMLSLDHVQGDGYAEGCGEKLYKRLKRQGCRRVVRCETRLTREREPARLLHLCNNAHKVTDTAKFILLGNNQLLSRRPLFYQKIYPFC